MNKAILLGTTGVAAALAMLAFGFVAGSPQAAKADTAQVVQVASVGHQDRPGRGRGHHPRLSLEEPRSPARSAGRARSQAEGRAAHRHLGVIKNAKDEIFNSAFDGVVGNPNGKVTIVEFYDYNCGFCKRAIDDMQALTKADPDLRFVLKEFPILGPDSQKAQRRLAWPST